MSPVETIKCECTDHGKSCVPIPVQHVRYDIRVGPEDQGIVKLCAHCYIHGCMGMKEYRRKAQQKARATDATQAG